MAEEPDHLVLRLLREIRAKQDEHGRTLEEHTARFERIDKQLGDMSRLLRYTLGKADETQFRQEEQEARIDDLFKKVEKLLSEKQDS